MNTTEAAKILGQSVRATQAQCKNGTLNAAKIGGRWVITLEAPATPADTIAAAHQELATRPGAPVGLLEIFDRLTMTREEFHAGLLELLDAGRALLEPEPKLRNLGARDRWVAIFVGGESKHLLWIVK